MSTRMSEVVQHLRKTLLQHDGAGLTDGQLLGRFIEQRDEAAAAALVRRHGPMVWGVCRRVLGNHHDVEDAFQATFLVLVRRASAIEPREMVGNWLYDVAHQTALKAKATLAKRRTRERQVSTIPEIGIESQPFPNELRGILDRELSRLPDKYRVAIVLCDLEGRTRMEAARQLDVPPGTLAARLTRGRALLAKRLVRHGLTVSGGTLAGSLSEQAVSACPMTTAVSSTIKAITASAAGQAVNTSVIPAHVAALTEGMVRTMFVSKIKIATGLLLALTVSAAGGLLYKTHASGPADEAPRVEQKNDDVRAAAIQALEQLSKSQQTADREAAIQALVVLRRELQSAEQAAKARKAEEARQLLQRKLAGAVQDLDDLFPFRVPIELGVREFAEGCRLDIVEVRGTRPEIEIGGQYLVRGKYKLPPGQRSAKIYFYATASGAWGAIGTTLDLQSTSLDKAEGEFTLVHGMLGEGNFHLVLADPERYSRMFANVYFGTGKNTLRKK